MRWFIHLVELTLTTGMPSNSAGGTRTHARVASKVVARRKAGCLLMALKEVGGGGRGEGPRPPQSET